MKRIEDEIKNVNKRCVFPRKSVAGLKFDARPFEQQIFSNLSGYHKISKMNKFKSRRRSGTGLKRSPAKGRSPFKKRPISKLAAGGNENVNEEIPENSTVNSAPANIKVAVRVRPENEREINSNHR